MDTSFLLGLLVGHYLTIWGLWQLFKVANNRPQLK